MLENNQAVGYMIMAAKDLRLDYETIKALKNKMLDNIETWTEEMADDTYDQFNSNR